MPERALLRSQTRRSLQAVAEGQAAAGGAGGGLGLGGDAGGGGLDLGGDAGGDAGGGLDLGGDDAPAADAGGDDAEGGGDDTLLAAPPGTRNAPRITPGAKGKVYHPQKTDSRPSGARTRNYSSIATPETNTYRTNNLGAPELRSLARGIYEEEEPIYSLREQNEEQKLLQVDNSILSLLEDLQNKKDLITEQDDES
jgi:hypothetical protein